MEDIQLSFYFEEDKIEIIKAIQTYPEHRFNKIYSAIFGRTAAYCSTSQITFIEKNTELDQEWLKKYSVDTFPTTLFFKNNILKTRIIGILPQIKIMNILEVVKYL